jgi:site-specific recombinase XerD
MKLNLCAVLVVYKKEMASAGLGAKEVCRRLADTEEFAEWLKERYGIADFREVERRRVKEYLAHLEAKVKPKTGDHLRRETVKSKLTALRMLFRSLAREELILSNPCEEVEYKVRRDDGRRVVLSEEEMARLLDMAGDDNPAGLRDRAMFELMYSSGLRCAEVVKLAVTDVDFERRFVMIRNAKFGRDRVVPMTEAAAAILAKYLETAGRLREEPVFPGGAGGRMSPLTVWKRFRRLLKKAGLVKPLLSPHSIRHSTATHLLEHGAGVRQVQELLGHSCIQTTVGYTHMLTESLKRIYKTHHPGENACFREVDDEYRRSVERLIGAVADMKRRHRRRKGGSGTG